MNPLTLRIYENTPIRIAIVDAYLGTACFIVGNIAYMLDVGYIPMVIRAGCDKPKGEEEMQR